MKKTTLTFNLLLVSLSVSAAKAKACTVTEKSCTPLVTPLYQEAREDGEITLCTKDGKCRSFKANEYAVVPRQKQNKPQIQAPKANPNVIQNVYVNVSKEESLRQIPITNENKSKPAPVAVKAVRVYRDRWLKKKNLLGVQVGYAPVGVSYSLVNSNVARFDLERGVVYGVNLGRRLGESDWLLNLQGFSNKSVILGVLFEY